MFRPIYRIKDQYIITENDLRQNQSKRPLSMHVG